MQTSNNDPHRISYIAELKKIAEDAGLFISSTVDNGVDQSSMMDVVQCDLAVAVQDGKIGVVFVGPFIGRCDSSCQTVRLSDTPLSGSIIKAL